MASKTEKYVGVAFSDFEECLTAARWAKEEFVKNKPPRLCVIFIEQKEGVEARDITDTIARDGPITWARIEEYIFRKAPKAGNVRTQAFQDFAKPFIKNIFGKIYEGPSIQRTLQFAIDELQPAGLDRLIVGCAAGAANTTQESSQTILPIHLDLPAGCSIVLVPKTDDGGAKNTEKEEEKKKEEKGKPSKITCMVVRYYQPK